VVLKDIALTGTGLFLVLFEAFRAAPNLTVMAIGVGLTSPSAYTYVRYIGGGGGGPSAPSSPPHGPLPSGLPPKAGNS
jgi:hypothetical protein